MLSLKLESGPREASQQSVQSGLRQVKVYRKMTTSEEQRVDLFDRAREIFVRARLQGQSSSSRPIV